MTGGVVPMPIGSAVLTISVLPLGGQEDQAGEVFASDEWLTCPKDF